MDSFRRRGRDFEGIPAPDTKWKHFIYQLESTFNTVSTHLSLIMRARLLNWMRWQEVHSSSTLSGIADLTPNQHTIIRHTKRGITWALMLSNSQVHWPERFHWHARHSILITFIYFAQIIHGNGYLSVFEGLCYCRAQKHQWHQNCIENVFFFSNKEKQNKNFAVKYFLHCALWLPSDNKSQSQRGSSSLTDAT